jgi:hypothetical protein
LSLKSQKIGIGKYIIMIIPQKVITWKNEWMDGLTEN